MNMKQRLTGVTDIYKKNQKNNVIWFDETEELSLWRINEDGGAGVSLVHLSRFTWETGATVHCCFSLLFSGGLLLRVDVKRLTGWE